MRGVTQRGEPLSSEGASYREGQWDASQRADRVPAKEGCSSTVQADLTRGKRAREDSPESEK